MPTNDAIQQAILALHDLMDRLQDQIIAGENARKIALLTSLNHAYQQAQSLETGLVNLLAANAMAAAAEDLATLHGIVVHLKAQSAQLQSFINTVSAIATILQAVAKVATLVAAL